MLGQPLNSTPGNPNGTFTPTLASVVTENYQESVNTLINGNVAYEWTPGLRSTLQVRLQLHRQPLQNSFFPQGVIDEAVTGTRSVTDRRRSTTTIDFSTNWERQLTDRLTSTLTFGGQSFRGIAEQ